MANRLSFSSLREVFASTISTGNSNESDKWKRLSENGGEYGAFGNSSFSGKSVSQKTAMQLAAFWACVRVNAQAMSVLPLQQFTKNRDGSREPVSDHEVADILTVSPNQDQTPIEFWESNIAWMLTQGNAYCEKRFIGDRLVALEPITQKGVEPKRTQDGTLEYHVQDRGQVEKLPRGRVFHLKGFGLGGDLGLSVIRNGVQTFGSAIATDETAGKIFGNGMHASGVLSSDQTLKKEQRTSLQKLMQRFVGSSNAGKMLVLEAGLKYEQISLNPEDAQMLETRRFNIEEICRWFGTPPIVVGHAADGQTMWGSGVEQILIAWLTLGINPIATRVEQRIQKQLFRGADRRRMYTEFNREALLQMDSNAKQRFLASMVNNGLMTRNEGRQKLNLPSVDGADDLTVQTALAPLDQLAQALADRNSNSN